MWLYRRPPSNLAHVGLNVIHVGLIFYFENDHFSRFDAVRVQNALKNDMDQVMMRRLIESQVMIAYLGPLAKGAIRLGHHHDWNR